MDGCLCAYVRAYVCVCMCLFMFVCVCLFVFVSRQAGRAHRVVVLPSGEARDGFNHARRIPLLTGTASQRRAKQATCEAQKGGKKSAHVCPPHLEGFFHAPKAACRQQAKQHSAKDVISTSASASQGSDQAACSRRTSTAPPAKIADFIPLGTAYSVYELHQPRCIRLIPTTSRSHASSRISGLECFRFHGHKKMVYFTATRPLKRCILLLNPDPCHSASAQSPDRTPKTVA